MKRSDCRYLNDLPDPNPRNLFPWLTFFSKIECMCAQTELLDLQPGACHCPLHTLISCAAIEAIPSSVSTWLPALSQGQCWHGCQCYHKCHEDVEFSFGNFVYSRQFWGWETSVVQDMYCYAWKMSPSTLFGRGGWERSFKLNKTFPTAQMCLHFTVDECRQKYSTVTSTPVVSAHDLDFMYICVCYVYMCICLSCNAHASGKQCSCRQECGSALFSWLNSEAGVIQFI